MGIILKQSFKNTIVTFIGFGFGALNTLFLYTNILEPTYYGLVTFILATGAILMPIMSSGAHNGMVKYYSAQKDESRNGFLTLMMISPLLIILPLTLIIWWAYDPIGEFLSIKNTLVKDYLWYLFLVGIAMAYFEVFYAWSKVHLKSVFGNFLKEVFARICVSILLGLLYFEVIDLDFFLKALVGVYLLRTLLMKLYAYSLHRPVLSFTFPKNTWNILGYGMLMVLGGSVALILLEIDKFMINQFMELDNVAFYGVAIYIATSIIVPTRAMHQITYPMTANYLNEGNFFELESLYKKTSLTSFIASGILFVLIVLNINDLFLMLPEEYRGGFSIIALIGMAKVFDSLLGNINAILYYSKYYKWVLVMGICFAVVTILLNLWLIPLYGIEGAALASFMAIFMFNLSKLIFVKLKFGFLPFSKATFKVFATLLLIGVLFYVLQFPFHPIINILLKSALIGAIYLGILFRFEISEDVSGVLSKWLRRREE
ncbi:lipopolysaccharide biosynthesis protein [Flagellimonas pacifica]|uniref:Membrane protein involved in the export of O-antigen and teichoic acid n=1 Tax=Flagellimonas pacifica TaxID=1247520 RepID=A0A285MRH8_9FLAO|nr:polysaccharide biosynthesis C-terminal domain-containing protein [Allomuricauda parva]SNY99782.1 Membrane protein involved in the export of O-antigen and teichoic acid [Allomuricauda parva]